MACSVEELSSVLKRDHIVVAKEYFATSMVKKLKSEASEALKHNQSSYDFGDALRLYGTSHKYESIKRTFLSQDFKRIAKSYYSVDHKFEAVFLTHEYKSDKMAPNGYLHADKAHALKFMIYLNDILDEDHGPFSYVPGSNQHGSRIRTNKHQARFHDDLKNMKAVPVLGKAGTLIIFSTNVLHMGGITKNGAERWIARAHWRP